MGIRIGETPSRYGSYESWEWNDFAGNRKVESGKAPYFGKWTQWTARNWEVVVVCCFFALQHLFACRACCPSRWHRLFEPATSWHPGNRAGWLPWIPVKQKCNSAGVDNLQKFQKKRLTYMNNSFISLTHQNKTQYPILSPFDEYPILSPVDELPKWVVIWWLYPDVSQYITSSYSTYIPFFPMASASGTPKK